MDVYIVTYLIDNYGSVLQAYALQSCLKELGANPSVLQNKVPNKDSFLHCIKRILRPQKHYSIIQRIRKERQKSLFKVKRLKISSFIDNNITVHVINDINLFKRHIVRDNIFLAGSDQIWSMLNARLSKWYTLQWIDSNNKYSYAASIGVDRLTDSQKQLYAEALSDFRVISLRESQAVSLLAPSFTGIVRRDIDPTLLYDGTFWRKMETKHRVIEEPYVFVYMLRPDKCVLDIAKRIAEERNCRLVYSGLYADRIKGATTICDAGIEEFLSLIDFSEAIITNSFHGTVFSILFHKPFLTVKLEDTSSRVESLLRMIGMESQLVDGTYANSSIPMVDFEIAERVLGIERQKSRAYLASICRE